MKRVVVLLMAVLFSVTFAQEKDKYGGDLKLEEQTKVSDIVSSPDEYLGKRVQIEGQVVGVCSKRGCWMDIAGDKDFEKLRVKVNDGEIVFPMEAKGKNAVVEGELYKVTITEEQQIKQAKHRAEHHGEELDLSKIKGPKYYYMLKGLGAEIEQ